jgi:hypothetical protein
MKGQESPRCADKIAIAIKNAVETYGEKQNLDDIPKETGTISASKGRASKKAASNRDLRRKQ